VQSLLEIIAVRDVYIWDLEVQLGEDRKKFLEFEERF